MTWLDRQSLLVPELLQQFQDFTEYVYDAVFLRADERSFSTPQEHVGSFLKLELKLMFLSIALHLNTTFD